MKANEPKPRLYILAGPNGAGKSTLYQTRIKPNVAAPFINADLIQKTEMKDKTPQGSYEAARIAEARRQDAIANRKSFVTETVFSHPSKNNLLNQAKEAGYEIIVFHVNVRNENLSVARVAKRVKEGGHDVPEDKVRARYHRNQAYIHKAVKSADLAYVYDNSVHGQKPKAIITFENGKAVRASSKMPKWARELYSQELRTFSPARLNKAAESFRSIGGIAKEQVDPSAVVLIPADKTTYRGPIIAESDLHALQRTRDGKLFGHFKTALNGRYKLDEDVTIAYAKRNTAVVSKSKPAVTQELTVAKMKKILRENEKPAKKAFEADLKLSGRAKDDLTSKRSRALLKAQKLAPSMLDKLKLSGVKTLKVQRFPGDSPAQEVRAVVKSASREYNQRGLGKVQTKDGPARTR